MESLQLTQDWHSTHFSFMNSLSSQLKLKPIQVKAFSAAAAASSSQIRRCGKAKASDAQLKENWLSSLSYPLLSEDTQQHQSDASNFKWVLGIDPDVSGAVALLKTQHSHSDSAPQVFDSPFVQILVGKRTRRRLDAKSIVQLVRSFDAPVGTTAYIEQSLPYPQDGKQGWWSGGFGYGLWIGILVASGFSVVPVPSFTWKAKFELSGNRSTKNWYQIARKGECDITSDLYLSMSRTCSAPPCVVLSTEKIEENSKRFFKLSRGTVIESSIGKSLDARTHLLHAMNCKEGKMMTAGELRLHYFHHWNPC
ncbi:Holliday junction resolvase MOC1, chloroplastic-like isoform X2 [Arachis stenosperma]|uniref:Holliday junction resolvase MOC1, chloroplastic-like isoform X2 n=1 Tax=Arachis stenosperma TaxID=217475 RepID=UPI0025AC32B6|nr:Holliday junction resolvase MOC1, chloroplastic-like isoform X2 [Arachis stenosperma]